MDVAEMQSIRELFLSHRGKCSDKWENYLDIYDGELLPFRHRGTPVSLLEIGVQDGGSLEVWKKALPPGSDIVGIDIDPRVADLLYAPGIMVLVGNAADDHTLQTLLQDRQFDLIIDDGSHMSNEIISTFEMLFSRVTPGGLFIIEDLACSYRGISGGGLRRPDAAIEWLKNLVDVVNGDHWNEEEAGAADLRLRQTYGPWIDRVTFHDGVTVVAKRRRPKRGPARRVLTGQTESQSMHIELFSALYAKDPDRYRFSEAFAGKVIQHLISQLEHLRNQPDPAKPSLPETDPIHPPRGPDPAAQNPTKDAVMQTVVPDAETYPPEPTPHDGKPP